MKIVVGWIITVVAGLVLFSACGGGGDEEPTPNSGTPTPAPESADVSPVACGPLLTTEEVDDALGWSIGDDRGGPILTARGEVCLHRLIGDADVFVQIQPGDPDDFEPGAFVIGVPGESLSAVGEEALWFGGEDSEAGGDIGVISVRQNTSLGALHFQIFLGRPDLDSAAQREIAKTLALAALPRFPGVEVEQPEPELVTFEPEPFDRAVLSFVENLLVKVEAGEWTLGEGLVATLKLATGELDAESVLRHEELLNHEGTGVLKMANEYLDDGPDDEAKAEITRLLDLLVFSNEQLEAMAGIGQATAALAGGLALGAARGQEEDCSKLFHNYTVPAGVGQCLEFATTFFSDDYRVFFPAPSLPTGGWDFGDYELAIEALEETVPIYEGLGKIPPVNIVFSVSAGGSSAEAAPKAGKACGVAIHTSMQSLSDDDFKQIIAHELAHCFQEETFTGQNKVDYSVVKWREEGLADYLSNVVYPDNNLEWDPLGTLAVFELQTTLFERAYTNSVFFQYLENTIGSGGIFALVRSLPTSGGQGDQVDKLAQFGGIEELYHDFVKAMTDEAVVDTGGGTIKYDVRADKIPISGRTVILEDPKRFGVVRLHLVVDPKYACIEYDENGELRSSWRDGEPGSPPGSWSNDLPDPLQGEAVFVVTATEDGATFTIEVTDVDDDDPECEEEEEDPDDCEIDFCEPSDYYTKAFGL
ncbi:MAG: hypothetical protein IH957_06255 [Chloroflexi bacterium]|nr:hypothetical protein [Chloroflexota bacterium]